MAWLNPSNMVGVGINHVTDSRNPVIRWQFHLQLSSGDKLTISKNYWWTDFRKVGVLLQQGSFCVFLLIPTQQSIKQE